jgi:hypothetical protein
MSGLRSTKYQTPKNLFEDGDECKSALTMLHQAQSNSDGHGVQRDPSRSSGSSGRERQILSSTACVACRSKHLKCDGGLPCSRCRAERVDCNYVKSRRGFKRPRRPKTSSSDSFGLQQSPSQGPVDLQCSSMRAELDKASSEPLKCLFACYCAL